MKKAYKIVKKFEMDKDIEYEQELPYIFFDEGMAKRIANNKQFCSDMNVMCDSYYVKEVSCIENQEDLDEMDDLYSFLESETIRKELGEIV